MLLTSMSEHEESNKLNEELKDSCDNDEKKNLSCKKWSSLLISIISNQEPLRYGTAMKLSLILPEGGTRSSVITSYFKVKKLEGARWRSSTILVHVTCLYLSWCAIPHANHNFATSQVVLPRAPLYNTLLDWEAHNTPSGYMDRDSQIKAMNQFSNICGTSPVNNQIIF